MADSYSIADLPPRIASKIKIDEATGCWEWQAFIVDGYGRARSTISTSRLAHRIVFELLVGDIPEGLQIDHLCRNRKCVNPAHLEPVTQTVNVMRGFGMGAINARRTECQHGHEWTTENIRYGTKGERICRECSRIRGVAWLHGETLEEAIKQGKYHRETPAERSERNRQMALRRWGNRQQS